MIGVDPLVRAQHHSCFLKVGHCDILSSQLFVIKTADNKKPRAKPGFSIFVMLKLLSCRGFIHLQHIIPIDHVIDECLKVLRTRIAIIDVVRMLPHIAAEDW